MARDDWARILICFTIGLFDHLPPPVYSALYLYARSQFNQAFLRSR